ncbi:MAG: hypothetical protein ACRD3D_13205 [Terriglobia bacterium]
MPSRAQFIHEDVSRVPRGSKVRTKRLPGGKEVRLAFPAGRRRRGSGKVVSILKPKKNPKKVKTREQVEKMQEKAIDFLRNVVGDDDKADEIEGLSLGEYADRKHVTLANPQRNAKRNRRGRPNPKVAPAHALESGSCVRVTMTPDEVADFNSRWPGGDLGETEIAFDFDGATGELLEAIAPKGASNAALLALAEEARGAALEQGALKNPARRRKRKAR